MAKKDKDASVLFELIAKNQGKIKGLDLVQPKAAHDEQTGAPELTPIESEPTDEIPSPEAPALPEEMPINTPEPAEPEAADDAGAEEETPDLPEAQAVEPEPLEASPISDTPLLAQAHHIDEPAEESIIPEATVILTALPEEPEAPQAKPVEVDAASLPAPAPLPVAAKTEKKPMDLAWLKAFWARTRGVLLNILAAVLAGLRKGLTWLRKTIPWFRGLGQRFQSLWSVCQPRLAGATQATVRFLRSKLALRIGLGLGLALVLLVIGIKLAPNGTTPVENTADNTSQTPAPPAENMVQVLIVTRLPHTPQGVRMAEYLADYCRSHGLAASYKEITGKSSGTKYAGVIIRTEFEDAESARAQALFTRVRSLPLQAIMNEEFGDLGESYQLAAPMYHAVPKRTD